MEQPLSNLGSQNFYLKNFLYFFLKILLWKKLFLYFRKRGFLNFLKRKPFIYFWKWKPLKIYISGNGAFQLQDWKISCFTKWNFLALIFKNFLHCLKRLLFLYFRKQRLRLRSGSYFCFFSFSSLERFWYLSPAFFVVFLYFLDNI